MKATGSKMDSDENLDGLLMKIQKLEERLTFYEDMTLRLGEAVLPLEDFVKWIKRRPLDEK